MKKQLKYYQIKDAYNLLKHPEKYKGIRPISLRSSYEIAFVFRFLDKHPSVIEWSNESIVIPYFDPTQNKYRRYFIDFSMTIKDKNGNIKKYLVEIKPKAQTEPPKYKRKTKNYYIQLEEYQRNQAKWTAAKEYAKEHGYDFIVLTEDFLPLGG